jgi:hypothetical protein
MINILPVIRPISILFGLLTIYLSLARGVDLINALFRGVIVVLAVLIVAVLANNVYLFIIYRMRSKPIKKAPVKPEVKESASSPSPEQR